MHGSEAESEWRRSGSGQPGLTSAWSFGTRPFDEDAKTGIRRELEAVHKAAGASLRSAVKPATCIPCKDERAGAAYPFGSRPLTQPFSHQSNLPAIVRPHRFGKCA